MHRASQSCTHLITHTPTTHANYTRQLHAPTGTQVPPLTLQPASVPPDELCWAWLSLAMSGASAPGAPSAQRVLQALPWADLATSLPGHLVCLVLLDVARGLGGTVGDAAVQGFVDWCWGLLSSPLGQLLMAVNAEGGGDVLEAMLALCVSQVSGCRMPILKLGMMRLVGCYHVIECCIACNHTTCFVCMYTLTFSHSGARVALVNAVNTAPDTRRGPDDALGHAALLPRPERAVCLGIFRGRRPGRPAP